MGTIWRYLGDWHGKIMSAAIAVSSVVYKADSVVQQAIRSGTGVSAFLPKRENGRDPLEAMLPFSQDDDFSLSITNGYDLRAFCMRLLDRYRYSTGPMNHQFVSLDRADG